ncbi:MAG: hypothetical protein ACM34O_12265, partial [Ignavibacteria bacterium]
PSILVFVLAFNFFHSEIIDQFEQNKECKELDYCKLVQAASIKTSSNDLSKLKIDKSICFQYLDENIQYTKTFTILDSEDFHTPQKTAKVYLFIRAFLI